MLANLGGRLCKVCHGVLHGSANLDRGRHLSRRDSPGENGKRREMVGNGSEARLMVRVIAVVPAQSSITSVGIPFEPGCKAVSELNQDGEHHRNHGGAPLAGARTRQRVEEKER